MKTNLCLCELCWCYDWSSYGRLEGKGIGQKYDCYFMEWS